MQAAGGNTRVGNGGGIGGSGGGGRIAVYYQTDSGFDFDKLTAPAGLAVYPTQTSGGVGTVYLRDTDEPSGTLIIGSSSDQTGIGVTPLGLPGLSTFKIPDAVLIQGSNTRVQNEHVGLVLDFQNSLTVQQSAVLSVEGPGFNPLQSVLIQSGASLSITGTATLGVPLSVSGRDRHR